MGALLAACEVGVATNALVDDPGQDNLAPGPFGGPFDAGVEPLTPLIPPPEEEGPAPDAGEPDAGPVREERPDASEPDPVPTPPDAGQPSGPFTLTSSAFAEGGTIPSVHTCAGADQSPALSWTEGPPGTQSYAVVFTDLSNSLIHWVIYDIPASARGLPGNVQKAPQPSVPAGAKQVRSYGNTIYGYRGPCPGGSFHTYRFEAGALDVAALPGVTTQSSRDAARAAILQRDLASAAVSGRSNASN